MSKRRIAVIFILGVATFLGAVSVSACIDDESTSGAEVEVVLETTASDDSTDPLERLELVFDHVELLDCEGPSPLSQRRWPSLIPRAQAAHLPEAPQRLLDASRWVVVDDAQPQPVYEAGTITPPLQDWCGLRFGFYSALPDTEAIDEGMPEGTSIQGIWQMPDAELEAFSGSIGFDIEYRASQSPLFESDDLRKNKSKVVLELDFDEIMASIDGVEDTDPPSPETIAQGVVDGASIIVDDIYLD